MKNVKLSITAAMVILGITFLGSCTKTTEQIDLTKDVVGTYQGKLSNSITNVQDSSIATITYYNDYTVRVHCIGGNVDTTFLLELYPEGSNMMVCATGDAYYKEYGNQKSSHNHMMSNGGMMTWENHMSDDHNATDAHYGNFNSNNNEFDYTIKMENSSSNLSERFIGFK
tara:strand:+ start:46947 stop:47456 length:510 start_codon:yes stop_codon:yes gene_type:complete